MLSYLNFNESLKDKLKRFTLWLQIKFLLCYRQSYSIFNFSDADGVGNIFRVQNHIWDIKIGVPFLYYLGCFLKICSESEIKSINIRHNIKSKMVFNVISYFSLLSFYFVIYRDINEVFFLMNLSF